MGNVAPCPVDYQKEIPRDKRLFLSLTNRGTHTWFSFIHPISGYYALSMCCVRRLRFYGLIRPFLRKFRVENKWRNHKPWGLFLAPRSSPSHLVGTAPPRKTPSSCSASISSPLLRILSGRSGNSTPPRRPQKDLPSAVLRLSQASTWWSGTYVDSPGSPWPTELLSVLTAGEAEGQRG